MRDQGWPGSNAERARQTRATEKATGTKWCHSGAHAVKVSAMVSPRMCRTCQERAKARRPASTAG